MTENNLAGFESIEARISAKLTQAFQPSHLEVRNDSHKHAGHQGSPNTGNSHFHLVIHSVAFTGLSRVAQQRLVYKTLNAEFADGLHALSMELKG